jgi:hypothetical protein
VELEAAFSTNCEALELAEQGEGLFRHEAELALATDVRFAASGDAGQDPASEQFLADRTLS